MADAPTARRRKTVPVTFGLTALAAACLFVFPVLWPGAAEGLANLALPGEHFVFSCAAGTSLPSDKIPQDAVRLIQKELTGRNGPSPAGIRVVSAELVMWGSAPADAHQPNPLILFVKLLYSPATVRETETS